MQITLANLIIANPPYSIGNKIISEAIQHLTDTGTAAVLMTLSQYKNNELYKHASTFQLADPKMFEDANIPDNLCICTLEKEQPEKSLFNSYQDVVIESCDKEYRLAYEWNLKHSIGLDMHQSNYKPKSYFHIDTDFLESPRCCSKIGGGGFGSGGFGWKWNIDKDENAVNAHVGLIRLEGKFKDVPKAKNNLQIWWYSNKKFVGLASKLMTGINLAEISSDYFFAIPQIDWEHISDKYPDYANDPDKYVLMEMGLKWNNEKHESIVEI